jgi:26S proteasome regulatory subunit N2
MRLLALSYNPHVRYGTALALGIGCACTGYAEALNMLEPMLNDSVDYVRQAAYIAISMVLQQFTTQMEPRVRNRVLIAGGKIQEDD